jgi:hypothetical protein
MRYCSLLILLVLSACYGTKKAEKQVGKALYYHPEIVAKIARNAFPCYNVKFDTITNDKLIYIDCPEAIHDSVIIKGNDTIKLKFTKFVKVPYNLPQITIYKSIEDSAKIKLLQQQIYNLTTNENILNYKISNKNKVIKWLIIFIVCLSIPYLFKLIVKRLS